MKQDLVPFVQAPPAAAACSMHGFKDRMPMHRGLLPVVYRLSRCQLLPHKLLCMAAYRVCAFFFKILFSVFVSLKLERNFDRSNFSSAWSIVCIPSPSFRKRSRFKGSFCPQKALLPPCFTSSLIFRIRLQVPYLFRSAGMAGRSSVSKAAIPCCSFSGTAYHAVSILSAHISHWLITVLIAMS